MSFEVQQIDRNDLPQGLQELLLITQQPDVQMLALTEEAVKTHARSWGAFATENPEVVMGYIGETRNYRGGSIIELGGLVVHPLYRGRGVGQALVKAATQDTLMHSDAQPIAFCNDHSGPLFKASGFRVAGGGSVPNEAYDFCGDCRKKPDDGCCDLVFTLATESTVTID